MVLKRGRKQQRFCGKVLQGAKKWMKQDMKSYHNGLISFSAARKMVHSWSNKTHCWFHKHKMFAEARKWMEMVLSQTSIRQQKLDKIVKLRVDIVDKMIDCDRENRISPDTIGLMAEFKLHKVCSEKKKRMLKVLWQKSIMEPKNSWNSDMKSYHHCYNEWVLQRKCNISYPIRFIAEVICH